MLSGLLKIMDLIELRTLLVMHRAKSGVLPEPLQKLFELSSEDKDHRIPYDFKHRFARTTLKQMCVSVAGVKLWNSQNTELKSCTTMFQLKKKFKGGKIESYKLVG